MLIYFTYMIMLNSFDNFTKKNISATYSLNRCKNKNVTCQKQRIKSYFDPTDPNRMKNFNVNAI